MTQSIVADFSAYQRRRNLSENTIQDYANLLTDFVERVGDGTVTKKAINDFLDLFIGQSQSSRAKKSCILRSFMTWAFAEDLLSRDFSAYIPVPKAEKKEVSVLVQDEASKVLREAYNAYRSGRAVGYRDYLAIYIMLHTGVRRAELVGLKVSDVREADMNLLVNGKGRKQRLIPIGDELVSLVYGYAEKKGLSGDDCIFSINERAMNNVVNKYMDKAGVKKDNESAHLLRRTFATLMYNQTGDIFAVSAILGHANVATTQRYVKDNAVAMRNATSSVKFDLEV